MTPMAFAIKAAIDNPRATTFAFRALKTMYGASTSPSATRCFSLRPSPMEGRASLRAASLLRPPPSQGRPESLGKRLG